jgi:hypothetical protein
MSDNKKRRVAGLVALVVILTLLYIHAACEDEAKMREHEAFESTLCKHGHEPASTREDTVRVIHEQKYKKALASRQTSKMAASVILGLMRGAIIGLIIGTDTGIIDGMVSFGSLNGILCWLGDRVNASSLIK